MSLPTDPDRAPSASALDAPSSAGWRRVASACVRSFTHKTSVNAIGGAAGRRRGGPGFSPLVGPGADAAELELLLAVLASTEVAPARVV